MLCTLRKNSDYFIPYGSLRILCWPKVPHWNKRIFRCQMQRWQQNSPIQAHLSRIYRFLFPSPFFTSRSSVKLCIIIFQCLSVFFFSDDFRIIYHFPSCGQKKCLRFAGPSLSRKRPFHLIAHRESLIFHFNRCMCNVTHLLILHTHFVYRAALCYHDDNPSSIVKLCCSYLLYCLDHFR